MKLMGLNAAVCAAMLVACGGDGRDYSDDQARRPAAAGATGADDLYGEAGDRAHPGARGDMQARLGADDRIDLSTPGSVGTSGQAQGPQAHGPDNAHDFMRKAAMTSHAEVQLGQLAAERAQSAEVKQFAQLMVRDHTKAGDELKQAVIGPGARSVDLAPELDEKHQQLLSRLRGLRGAEFDREYMKAMVQGHQEAKSMLETRANNTLSTRSADQQAPAVRTDRSTAGTSGVATGGSQLENSINQWATRTLPTVQQHLQQAQQIDARLGNSAGATPSGSSGAAPRGGDTTGAGRGAGSQTGETNRR